MQDRSLAVDFVAGEGQGERQGKLFEAWFGDEVVCAREHVACCSCMHVARTPILGSSIDRTE